MSTENPGLLPGEETMKLPRRRKRGRNLTVCLPEATAAASELSQRDILRRKFTFRHSDARVSL